ncbi:uncharacterized protein LOC132704269 isoform X2 [Cylas formicarius]|uniref:uncharacterized protein LOC132704269 isoform X2 n=1 Tax=Cylas formicarius TaxID=197179 RepID=UPI0029586838|nr:uncharacterized protein LOC132704269 isoform X2 [Cylas formicarius]
MKCFVSSACVLSVLLATACAAPLVSTGLQVSGGASTGGGGLTNILSNIDLPGLLQGVNSLVKLVGAFCPPLSQVLDNVVQNVTSTAFRVFGRIILRSGGLGGGSGNSGASGSGGGQRVNVVLPTFPPDDDEDYDDEDNASSTVSSSTETINPVTAASAGLEDEASNAIAKRHVRVVREAEAEAEAEAAEDQEGAESAPEPGEETAEADDQDRLKRFLPWGGGDDHGHNAGSGNFLFDIIRLVAGSGASEGSDEHDHGGVAEIDIKHDNGEGIPGPITRFFVIANRGIANVIQDLILRLAQTSERLVNFKARLITSLI